MGGKCNPVNNNTIMVVCMVLLDNITRSKSQTIINIDINELRFLWVKHIPWGIHFNNILRP